MSKIQKIKELREKTSLSIKEIEKALNKTDGNLEKALKVLKKQAEIMAAAKKERKAAAGVIDSYVHFNRRIGVLLELNCETDFVARNPQFRELAHDLALQIASSPADNVATLLKQEFIKDTNLTVDDLIKSKMAILGENIKIKRFQRYTLGE